ncbi:hypothetical protein Ancab_038497 [Ancistrocladus abbreviatus]
MESSLLFMTGRDLQRMSGDHMSKVGYLSTKEIKELDGIHQLQAGSMDQRIPTIEDALMLVSSTARQVILDAKVGPPAYEKGLAEDILSVELCRPMLILTIKVRRTNCMNCIVWAKSDTLVRDIIRLSANTTVGYIVMNEPFNGRRSNLLRMKKAAVVGIYHPLIDKKLVSTLHGRQKKVYAWTVDDEVSMQRMLSMRVDAVVSSNPTVFQGVMLDTRTRCLEDGFSLPR